MAVNVQVCLGPECQALGSQGIINALEKLPVRERKLVDLIPHYCVSRCNLKDYHCPSVRVNQEWVADASEVSVKEQVKALVNSELCAAEKRDNTATDPFAKYFP